MTDIQAIKDQAVRVAMDQLLKLQARDEELKTWERLRLATTATRLLELIFRGERAESDSEDDINEVEQGPSSPA